MNRLFLALPLAAALSACGSADEPPTDLETARSDGEAQALALSLIHISEPTRQAEISYAVFCLKKKT